MTERGCALFAQVLKSVLTHKKVKLGIDGKMLLRKKRRLFSHYEFLWDSVCYRNIYFQGYLNIFRRGRRRGGSGSRKIRHFSQI